MYLHARRWRRRDGVSPIEYMFRQASVCRHASSGGLCFQLATYSAPIRSVQTPLDLQGACTASLGWISSLRHARRLESTSVATTTISIAWATQSSAAPRQGWIQPREQARRRAGRANQHIRRKNGEITNESRRCGRALRHHRIGLPPARRRRHEQRHAARPESVRRPDAGPATRAATDGAATTKNAT